MACSAVMDTIDAIVNNNIFEKVVLGVADYVCMYEKLALDPIKICP